MFIVNFIRMCGRHPFATGLLALIGLAGTAFSIFTFFDDKEGEKKSEQAMSEIRTSVDSLGDRMPVAVETPIPPVTEAMIDAIASQPQFRCVPPEPMKTIRAAIAAELEAINVRAASLRIKERAEDAERKAKAGVEGYGYLDTPSQAYGGQLVEGQQRGLGSLFERMEVYGKLVTTTVWCDWLDHETCRNGGVAEGNVHFERGGNNYPGTAYGLYVDGKSSEVHPHATMFLNGIEILGSQGSSVRSSDWSYAGQVAPTQHGAYAAQGVGVLRSDGSTRETNGSLRAHHEEIYASWRGGALDGYYFDIKGKRAGQVVNGVENPNIAWEDSCFR